jgi:hypothetical protein
MPGNSRSGRRKSPDAKRTVTLYVSEQEVKDAHRMKELGIITTIAEVWRRGHQSLMAEVSKEAREREIAELQARVDGLKELYATAEVRRVDERRKRSELLDLYCHRARPGGLSCSPGTDQYRNAQTNWLDAMWDEVKMTFPNVTTPGEAFEIIESMVRKEGLL